MKLFLYNDIGWSFSENTIQYDIKEIVFPLT
jgi:hypothetical protein